jgi:serine/threonine protein kinase
MSEFKKLEKLGEGTYGVVYKAIHIASRRLVALKKVKKMDGEEGVPGNTIREISILKAMNHPAIIGLNCAICEHGELHLVFDFMSCDLRQFLDELPRYLSNVPLSQNGVPRGRTQRRHYLPLELLKKMSYHLIEGIRYCHSRRVLHRDLKPQNILINIEDKNRSRLRSDSNLNRFALDDKNMLKIADFGLGKEHGLPIVKLTHEVVTLWYRCPEILMGIEKYSGACDVWSIACIIAEMATGRPFMAGDCEIDQLFKIFQMLGTPNEQIWPGISELPDYNQFVPQWKPRVLKDVLRGRVDESGCDLLLRMLAYHPAKRISCLESLMHPWFDDVREDMIRVYGNVYPHCGSREWQIPRIKREMAAEREQEQRRQQLQQRQQRRSRTLHRPNHSILNRNHNRNNNKFTMFDDLNMHDVDEDCDI